LLALLAALAAPATAGAVVQSTESYQALQAQISSGQVARATVNKLSHDVKVTLKNGGIQSVIYPSSDYRTLLASLHAHGVQVKFASHKKKKAAAVHHHLRYIAGGILAALIVIGGGAYVISRRREPPAGAAAPPSGASPPQDPGST
jgi:ATP-dependent Zn protease